MGFWDDLSSGFASLVDAAGGDQESKDSLPPPGPKIVLSQRLQRFLNTLLGPMNAAWGALKAQLPQGQQYQAGDGDAPPVFGLRNVIYNDPNLIAAAQNYLDYSQWVIPYLQAIGKIIDPGFWGGEYTGQDYINILEFLQVSKNDFENADSWNTYASPHLTLAIARQAELERKTLLLDQILPVNPVPAAKLPPDSTNPFVAAKDELLGNQHGDGMAGTYAAVTGVLFLGVGVALLYFLLRRR